MGLFNRPPLEERIAQRQRELGPLEHGKYFEHAPARFLFTVCLSAIVVAHLVALSLFFFLPDH
ncbi:hypothetical protein ACFQ07_21155 [Actinomadura adrarensis]|uniref:Uncharacterized protein n=1 Tax=Actinomadura adrarensis TaxID=1819600 RepID=A0ABW3CMH0_9ACTN